jgi:hypothetical protein
VRNAQHAQALVGAGVTLLRLAMPAEPEMLHDFPGAGLAGVRLREDRVDGAAIARIRARKLPGGVTAGFRRRREAPGSSAPSG